MRQWLARRRAAARKDVDDELQSHLAARIDYLVARGMPEAQARIEALRRFGNLDAGREALYRNARSLRPPLRIGDRMHDLLQDIRYVARGLRRSPAFTIGVVTTLALGLGVNAAVFRVADVVLFRAPAGVVAPNDVLRLELAVTIGRGAPMRTATFAYPDADRAVRSTAFAKASAYVQRTGKDDAARELTVNYVDGHFFDVLGTSAAIGRVFTEGEGRPGSQLPAAIVSHSYWVRALGQSPINSSLQVTINSKAYPVVGIMPAGFTGIDLDPTDVWLPLGVGDFGRAETNGVVIPWYQTNMMRAVRVIGRRPPAVGTEQVTRQLNAALRSEEDEVKRDATLSSIVPVGAGAGGRETNALLGRLTVVALIILAIACANAVNLLLARGLRRHQEIAIRMAIGSSRTRVSRLLIIESVLLAALGGVATVIASFWTSEALRRLLFPDAKWTAGAFDLRTLVFTGALALAAGLLAGLAPARQATTPDLVTGLKQQRTHGGRRTRLTRTALIVLQTSLSLALLVATGLMVRSLAQLNAVPLGFAPDGLVTASLSTPRFGGTPDEFSGVDLAARIQQTGRASAIATASNVPFGAMAVMTTKVIGATQEPSDDQQGARWTAISANYFAVMGTRVVSGRGFAATDIAGSEPVIVINESMSRAYFGGPPPATACVMPVGYACMRIVGVVEDVRDTPNGSAPPMRYYMPLRQVDVPINGVLFRTTEPAARELAAFVKQVIPTAMRSSIDVVADRVAVALRPWHSATWLFGALGALALILACVGLYSVMSYVASERRQELGIRVVLGATSGDILRLISVHGLRTTLTGCALGIAMGAVVARYLDTLLFGVSPFDPATYIVSVVALLFAGVIAVLPPAMRASRVDPIAAFRQEG